MEVMEEFFGVKVLSEDFSIPRWKVLKLKRIP
jgi:hypothetical protein